jgi:glycosyltransferase involved in cell wall biosynthesis
VDILVVDDGSDDVTRRVARDHGSKVLRLRRNSGIGVAMKAGYRYAVRRGHHYAVQVDADGQHDPKFIESMIRPLLAGECDLVIGSRFLENRGFVSSFARRIGIRFFSFLLFLLTRQWISDPTSGNRAMNRKSLELFAVDYPFDYPEPESLLTLIQGGLRVKEVPIRMDPRRAGKSSISIERAFYYMIKVTLAILFRFFKPRASSPL